MLICPLSHQLTDELAGSVVNQNQVPNSHLFFRSESLSYYFTTKEWLVLCPPLVMFWRWSSPLSLRRLSSMPHLDSPSSRQFPSSISLGWSVAILLPRTAHLSCLYPIVCLRTSMWLTASLFLVSEWSRSYIIVQNDWSRCRHPHRFLVCFRCSLMKSLILPCPHSLLKIVLFLTVMLRFRFPRLGMGLWMIVSQRLTFNLRGRYLRVRAFLPLVLSRSVAMTLERKMGKQGTENCLSL